jgi:sugar lactone lactonase YvrE
MMNRGRASLTLLVSCTVAGLIACGDRAESHDVPQWTLTETLRIGTMEEGPASFGGWIKGIDADGQGRVWVLDRETQEIRVFSADGAHLMNVGRKGSGPGEFRDAEGIAFAKDGRLWVRDAANARLSAFASDGSFEDSRATTFCWSQGLWDPVMANAERILDRDCYVRDGQASGYYVVGYKTDLSGVDTIADLASCGDEGIADAAMWVTKEGTSTRYRGIPWAPEAHTAVGAAGETWCVPNSSRFEILRLVPGATDTARLRITIPDVPVTQAERDSAIAEIEKQGPTGLDFSRIPTMKPAIDRINVDDEGRLWVRHTASDGAANFAVFSPAGALLATARLPGYQLGNHVPFVVRGDAIYTATVDHEDVPLVVRITITKPRS